MSNVSSHYSLTGAVHGFNASFQSTLANVTMDEAQTCHNDFALEMTRFSVQKVLVPVVSMLGFVGNIFCAIILTRRSMISSTNCYLTALAVFDCMYIVFSFTLSLNHYQDIGANVLFPYWFRIGRVLTDISSNVSVCLTVTFSLERLVAVCYPMKGRLICTPKRARIITLAVVLFAVMCTFPEFFEKKVVVIVKNNISTVDIQETAFAQTDSYKIIYYNFIAFSFTFIPLILLMTFNGLLVKTVYTAMKLRQQMTQTWSYVKRNTRRESEQTRITIMLIGVVLVFLLCQSPNAALLLYTTYLQSQRIQPTPCEYNNLYIAGNFVNLLVLINASINFILYSAMSSKFRRVCVRVLCFCRKYGIELFTKTDTSTYNGHSLKETRLPIYFRSKRRCNYDQGQYLHFPLNHHFQSVRYENGKYHVVPRKPNILMSKKSSSSSHNDDPCSSKSEDDILTPLAVRRQNKSRENGSSVYHKFRPNNNNNLRRQLILTNKFTESRTQNLITSRRQSHNELSSLGQTKSTRTILCKGGRMQDTHI